MTRKKEEEEKRKEQMLEHAARTLQGAWRKYRLDCGTTRVCVCVCVTVCLSPQAESTSPVCAGGREERDEKKYEKASS